MLVAGQLPAAAIELGDAQRASADVGDASGHRVGAGVEDGAVDDQLARLARQQPCHEQVPAERERSDRAGGIGGVGGDAAGAFSHSFASQPLLDRKVLVVGSIQQVQGVGDQPLLARGDVEHPQAVHRVVAGAAAGEEHPLPVGRHGDGPRITECESLRSCVLPWKRVAHRCCSALCQDPVFTAPGQRSTDFT